MRNQFRKNFILVVHVEVEFLWSKNTPVASKVTEELSEIFVAHELHHLINEIVFELW